MKRFNQQQASSLLFLLFVYGMSFAGSSGLVLAQSQPQSQTGLETVPTKTLSDAPSADESETSDVSKLPEMPAGLLLPSEKAFNSLSALSWLTRLALNTSQLNFEVSFVVSRPGAETQPYIWRHAQLSPDVSVEQLSLLNGPGFEYIRYNDVVSVFEPGFPAYSIPGDAIDGPIPPILLTDPASLKTAYEFVLVGRSRVSGFAAQQLRIIPRDRTRYGYHLWLDEETGMLLKLNTYSLQGKLLEQVQVTQLHVNDRVKDVFESLQLSSLPRVITMKNPPQREHEWDLGFVPVGMKRVKQDTHRLAITGQIVEYTMFSDGLVDVSIYIQQASDVFAEGVEYQLDTRSVLSRTNGRVQVTIVGEIPLVTAAKIAESIILVE